MSAVRPMIQALAFSLPLLALAACGQGDTAAPEAPAAAPEADAAAGAQPAPAAFDPLSVPVSDKDLGAFPYVSAIQGFDLRAQPELELERKYLFPGGALRPVEGRYRHADVYVAQGGTWNETLLMRRLDEQVQALGGVQVFDGPMPAPVGDRVRAEEPRFVKDLYDPWPYRFRQYLVRTPRSLVWIEAGYGYNTEMADLTVIEEPLPPAPAA